MNKNEVHEQWLGRQTLAGPGCGPNEQATSVNGQRGREATRHKQDNNTHAMMSWHCFLILTQNPVMGQVQRGSSYSSTVLSNRMLAIAIHADAMHTVHAT